MEGMKEFGQRLARMIYNQKMSDEEILRMFPDIDPNWLRDQIKEIRMTPEWRNMANAFTLREVVEMVANELPEEEREKFLKDLHNVED